MHSAVGKKGFTMIEIITVLVILVLLAAVVAPNAKGFIENSEQSARNSVARTIFLAAQTAITQTYGRGNSMTAAAITGTTTGQFRPGLSQAEQVKADDGRLVYLAHSCGAGQTPLTLLLEPYLSNKAVLNDSYLIEFNKETGNVLSAFYTEKETVGSLGYAGADYNVCNRTEQALRAGYVGFYGVDSTGEPIGVQPIGTVDVQLVDYVDPLQPKYGLLIAECTLPDNPDDEYQYELLLEPQQGTTETLSIAGKTGGTTADLYLPDLATTLEQALANPVTVTHNATARKIVAWKSINSSGGTTLNVVLDGVHENLGIRTNYPGISSSYLSASFSATDGNDTSVSYSNLEHAYFADKITDGTGAMVYQVASVRHLNNVRYELSAHFEQTADVACLNYQLGALNFTPIAGKNGAAFTGTYGGGNHRIRNLTIAGVENAGLFDTIGAGGTVKNVNLSVASAGGAVSGGTIHGTVRAGGIAAVNNGGISNCSVVADVTNGANPPKGAQTITAGGIAGINNNRILGCFAACNVTGGQAAGGIAGINNSEISFCEVATASKNGVVVGTPYYGARNGSADYKPDEATYGVVNNAFFVEVVLADGAAGGIAGDQSSGTGVVRGCVNAAEVRAGSTSKSAGGIVGLVNTGKTNMAVQFSYNAGSVRGAGSSSKRTTGDTAVSTPTGIGGVIGTLVSGKVYACYNNGYVNITPSDRVDLESRKRRVKTHENSSVVTAGGIVGYGGEDSLAESCYNTQYAGDCYGGAFGVMEGTITNCAFLENYWNTTNEYRNDTGTGIGTTTGLKRLSALNLRAAQGIFTTGTFLPNTQNINPNGVGWFQYIYPYLNLDTATPVVCDLGARFHRTRWESVVDELGRITVTSNSSTRVTFRYLISTYAENGYAELYLMADNLWAIHVSQNQDVLDTVKSGSATVPYTVLTNNTKSNFRLNVVSSGLSAEELALGYAHAFTFTVDWSSADYVANNILLPGAPSAVTAYLYQGGAARGDSEKLYDSARASRPGYGKISNANLSAETLNTQWQGANQNRTFLVLEMTVPQNLSAELKIIYTDGTPEQTIRINGSDFNNAPTTLEAAYANKAYWMTLDGTARFPLYHKNNKFYLILARLSTKDTFGGFDGINDPNGLESNKAFYVQYSDSKTTGIWQP